MGVRPEYSEWKQEVFKYETLTLSKNCEPQKSLFGSVSIMATILCLSKDCPEGKLWGPVSSIHTSYYLSECSVRSDESTKGATAENSQHYTKSPKPTWPWGQTLSGLTERQARWRIPLFCNGQHVPPPPLHLPLLPPLNSSSSSLSSSLLLLLLF